MASEDKDQIVDLNVGGVIYSTKVSTFRKLPGNGLTQTMIPPGVRDSKGRYFIDRDGVLFRFILDFLRNDKLVLPEGFQEYDRLMAEAEHFKLTKAVQLLETMRKNTRPPRLLPPLESVALDRQQKVHVAATSGNASSEKAGGYLTVGYRGTFAFGRDGVSDVNFRKLSRILVCGKVKLCREVFGDTLNESRDPDRGEADRYTSRFFLKHTFLEQAFDTLAKEHFIMVGCSGSGTSSSGELKPGLDPEENKWSHYNEFTFYRE